MESTENYWKWQRVVREVKGGIEGSKSDGWGRGVLAGEVRGSEG